MAATLSQLTSWRAHTQLHAHTEDTHEVRHVRPAAPATAALPKLWAAVRACARDPQQGVLLRSREFIVKGEGAQQSGRQPEEVR